MKKILIAALILCMLLSGCGNASIGFGNYTFRKVHVDTHHFSGCLTVERWYDTECGGVEVVTKEAGAMYLAEGTYIMLQGEKPCPFCGK